jgi:serine/threonine protein kinase
LQPENVMVDLSSSTPVLKLVDFGDSVNTSKSVILPPACLEFASPELVLGQPVGKHTDCWAAGVFFYVLLSGVSPFLDDSMEETTANILKCDYCFPDDYFKEISLEAKDLINKLLVLVPSQRVNMDECLASTWITTVCSQFLFFKHIHSKSQIKFSHVIHYFFLTTGTKNGDHTVQQIKNIYASQTSNERTHYSH